MYRILMLCKDTATVSSLIQAYFAKASMESIEVFVVGLETAELPGEVAEFLKEQEVSLGAIAHHTINDFQDVPFDYLLTFDNESEEFSHHLPSHSVKYHFNPGISKLSSAGLNKLYQELSTLLNEFIQEHF